MQWLTMSMPTPRTLPRRAASSTLVPTPSAEATSTGSSSARIGRADITPPKLPTPRSTSGAERAFDGAGHPLDRARALVDVDARVGVRREHGARRPPPDVAAHVHVRERHAVHAAVRSGAGGGEVVAQPGDGEHSTARRLAVA